MATNEQWRGKLSDGNNYNTEVGTADFTVTQRSGLSAGETFSGVGERNDYPAAMVSCLSSHAGTLFFDFSVDKVKWVSEPSEGYLVAPNAHQFKVALKGPRFFRVRYENGSAAQTYCQIATYFGDYDAQSAENNALTDSNSDVVDQLRLIATEVAEILVESKITNQYLKQIVGENNEVVESDIETRT